MGRSGTENACQHTQEVPLAYLDMPVTVQVVGWSLCSCFRAVYLKFQSAFRWAVRGFGGHIVV